MQPPGNRAAVLELRLGLQSSDTGSCAQSASLAAPRDVARSIVFSRVNAISLQRFQYSETPLVSGIPFRAPQNQPLHGNYGESIIRKRAGAEVTAAHIQGLQDLSAVAANKTSQTTTTTISFRTSAGKPAR
jgi:hypothetical protein